MTPSRRTEQSVAGESGDQAASAPARSGILADRNTVEVRFGGSGGQGVVLMGIILATAANYDRRWVVQSESYGPEARGGYSRSDVIISSDPIEYPMLLQADLLVALSQTSADTYISELRKDGVLMYDSEKVADPPTFRGKVIALPFTRMAVEETGRVQTANVLALGAVAGVTGIVSVDSIRRAVAHEVPQGTQELNGRALARGLAVDSAEF